MKTLTYSFYYSNDQVVCVVQRPTLLGLLWTTIGTPYRLRVEGSKSVSTLKGLHHELYVEHEPDIIIYQLADGTLLAADEKAIDRAETSMNASTNFKKRCLEHYLVDLKVVDGLPVKTSDYALVK